MANNVLIDQSNNTIATDTTSTRNSVIVSTQNPNTVTVVQTTSGIVSIAAPGPQGPQGPVGVPADISGYLTTASFNAITSSMSVFSAISSSVSQTSSFAFSGDGIFSGSFSGSFSGDGSELQNIPASSVIGLNLSQITSGSYSASISEQGLLVNTRVEAESFSGSFSGSFEGDASGLTNIQASSVVGLNLSQITSGSYSASISEEGLIINNRVVAESFTGSLYGTSSWAENSIQSLTASSADSFFVRDGLTVLGNLDVYGSSSFTYVTSSQLIVGTNTIAVNVFEPVERFGGLLVYDSGSSNATASLFWDSLRNHWIYENVSGSTYTGGGLLSGPRNTGSLGSETYPTTNTLVRGQGGDHLYDSNIKDDDTKVSISIPVEVTGSVMATEFTGSGAGLTNIPSSAIVGLNLSQIATGSVTASVAEDGTIFRLTSGSGEIALTYTNTGLLVHEYSTPPYFRLYNNNSNIDMTAGQAVGYIEILGRRTSSSATFVRIATTYIGDGTTRNARFSIGTAETSGFGGNQFAIFKTTDLNRPITILGTGVDSYATSSTSISQSFGVRANVIVNGSTNLPILAIDRSGVPQSIVFNNGNWGINTVVDSGFKFDISGSARVQAGLQITGSTNITGSLNVNSVPVTTGTGSSGQLVTFSNTSSLSGSSNLFWDSTNRRLGINSNLPTSSLYVKGVGSVTATNKIFRVDRSDDVNLFEISNENKIDIFRGSNINLSQEGIFIHGPFSTNFGNNLSNKGIITFINWESSSSIYSGIQAASSNFGNVRAGVYFIGGNSIRFLAGSAASPNDKNMFFSSGGNFTIGSLVDAGFRLDVSGSARIQENLQVTGSTTITGSLTINNNPVIIGTGSATQLTFWNSNSTISGSNNLFWSAPDTSLLIGTNNISYAFGHRIRAVGTTDASIAIFRNQASTSAAKLEFFKSRGTYDAPVVLNANDQISSITSFGWPSVTAQYANATLIQSIAESIGTTGIQGRLNFITYNSGGSNFGNMSLRNSVASPAGGAVTVISGDSTDQITTPRGTLHVRGVGTTNANNTLFLENSSGIQVFSVSNNGQVLIGTGSFSSYLLDVSGSSRFSANMEVTGSITATSFTGSLLGTSSFANTASFVATSSWSRNSITSSYAATASVLLGSIESSSFATTASFALNAATASYVLAANVVGLSLSSISSGSYSASISDQGLLVNNTIIAESVTASLYGTSSWALNSISTSLYIITASFISSSYADTASVAITASYAITSSYSNTSEYYINGNPLIDQYTAIAYSIAL